MDPAQFGLMGAEFGGHLAPSHPEWLRRDSAYAVILRGWEIALVLVRRPTYSYLSLPGGGRHPGESPLATVRREAEEEIGYAIEVTHEIARANQFLIGYSGEAILSVGTAFYARLGSPVLKSRPEHQLVWVDLERALRLLRHEYHAYFAWKMLRSLRSEVIYHNPAAADEALWLSTSNEGRSAYNSPAALMLVRGAEPLPSNQL